MEQQDPDAAGTLPADRLSNPTEQYSSLEPTASFSQSSGHQHHTGAHPPAHDTAARSGPAELAAEQFYKTYQPAANDTNGSTSSATSLPLPKEPISNGAAPATRHIGLVSTRHPRQPNPRSMPGSSAPSAVRLPSGPVSVKDLKKRFDHQDETIPPPRPNYRPAAAASTNKNESTNLRSRHTSTAPRPRTSGASEKSFASRIQSTGRTENSDPLSRQQSNSSATSATSGSLLFGEILPGQNDTLTAGHGIEVVRPRRASEAGVHELAGPAFRYDDGPEPAAPSSWYRDAEMFQQEHVHELRHATPHKRPGRSQSDAPPANSTTSIPTDLNNTPTTSHNATVSPTSKLPIPVRRLPPLSTVDHTPSPYNASLTSAKSSQPSSISSARSSPNSSRTKIPAGSPMLPAQAARERQPYGSDVSSRSTRSRHVGAAASTASSRMRERESARSRAPGSSGSSRRRLVSIGPEDFEQRREHIRLAYTKSIRESQVIEAQKLEELRRREQELQAVPAAELPASKSSELKPAERSTARDSIQSNSSQRSTGKLIKRRSRANSERKGIMEGLASTLSISTAMGGSQRVSLTSKGPFAQELPGSVPMSQPAELDNYTPSSATSVVTEFDVEPQEGLEEQDLPQDPSAPITAVRPPSPPQPELPTETKDVPNPATFQREIEVSFTKKHEHKTSDATIAPTAQMKASLSGIFTDEFEESLSLKPPMPTFKSYETTVTILSDPNVDTSMSSRENLAGQPTSSFRASTAEESDCYSELDAGAEWQNATGDLDGTNINSYAEDADNRSRADETHYATDSQFDSRRASAYESSDMGGIFDEMTSSMYEQRLQESTALSLPSFTVRSDRFSRQSGWTEYTDTSGVADTSTRNSVQHGFDNNHTSTSSPQSVHFRQHRDSSMNDFSETDDASALSMPLGQTTSHSSTHLPVPEHEPPPIPTSASENALDTFHNKDIVTRQPDTTDQEQETTPVRDFDSKPLPPIVDEEAAKAKRKLGQRRNVIKELMDTEAIFVRDMNVVKEIYKGTAEACPKLDDQTVKLIFRNTDDIINFHSVFLADLTRAVAPVYMTKSSRKSMMLAAGMTDPNGVPKPQLSAELDRQVSIGPLFEQHLETMKSVHEVFLRNSDHAIKRLIEIQQEPSVRVWLAECNSVAKDLTAAWDLDSLLIKPMQRITKYPNLIITLLQHTPNDHPDQIPLMKAKDLVENAILEINKTKKNFELVGQIVGRKRRESDVKTGLARAFGKRVDKLQAANVRPIEDPEYEKLKEKFGDDYLRLQVVLRDVEFYTRQVSEYCHEFLQYLSSIELVMRLQPGAYPELESKWVQFNISMRDLEKVVLEQHLAQVRKLVIEPFEQVIKAYGNPSLAMKKRLKRRPDWERGEQLRRSGKTLDSKLREQVEQYEALNEALKTELPKLSRLTEKVGNICLGNFVNIQAKWYQIWIEKMRTVANDSPGTPEIHEIVTAFQRDFPYAAEQVASIGMLDPAQRGRISQSTSTSADDPSFRHSTRSRTVDGRARGMSMNDDSTTNLHASQRHSGSVPMSPSASNSGVGGAAPSPHQYYYRDYYTAAAQGGSSSSPKSTDASSGPRSTVGTGFSSTRPSTSRSAESGALPRQSVESAAKRDSSSAYVSGYSTNENNRFSNMFHSALPPDNINESGGSQIHEMGDNGDGYNVLWLAASLFEFNISTTKHEAGYPYLTYQAGEIFDVIAEKGELWLAKNQDDQTQQVGWIWSKHFARLADS